MMATVKKTSESFSSMPKIHAITAHDAWTILSTEPNASLIDVRTPEEWNTVGIADLSSLQKEVQLISWRTLPGMQVNNAFAQELTARAAPAAPALFLCRSGARSHEAAHAALALGYTHCYNIIDGFEGTPGGARNQADGWKALLPWRQA